jgi:chromosome segregation ATPase
VQALRRALENEALVTAQMEERVRALTARQSDLEAELAAEKDARAAAEETLKGADSAREAAAQALIAAEARAEAAETAAAAAADAAEERAAAAAAEPAPAEPDAEAEANRALLDELANRLRRLRQTTRRERATNQVLRDQVEKGGQVDPAAVNAALKADLDTLTALREAEMTETALILAELRPLVQGGASVEAEDDLEDAAPAMADETGEA